MLTALLLAGLALQQPEGPHPHTARIAGKEVKWSFAASQPTAYPDEVLNWSGWSFLPTGPRTTTGAFRSYRLPANIEDLYAAAHSKITESTPVWRTKIVVFRESDILDRDENGVLRRRYSTIEPYQFDELIPSLARFAALVEIITDGALRVQVEVHFDTEPQRFESEAGNAWGEAFARSYFGPRLNGPGFEPDDKIFRGPYASVFYLHPGLTSGSPTELWINDSPVCGISLPNDATATSTANLDATLLLAWERQVHQAALQRMAGADFHPSTEDWRRLAGPMDMESDEQVKLMLPHIGAPNVLQRLSGMFRLAPNSENVSLSVTPDEEKGEVLTYTERGLHRFGGATLPKVAGSPLINVSQTPFLSFEARSISKDPVALTIFSNTNPPLEISLGGGFPARDPSGAPRKSIALSFRRDGSWQRVTIDLRKHLEGSAGPTVVTDIQIAPPLNSTRFSKATVGPIQFQFAPFKSFAEEAAESTVSEDPVPDLNSPSEESRALALARLSSDSPKDQVEGAVRLLADPNGFVRLNAANAFSRIKSTAAPAALIQAAKSIDPRVAAAAIRALAHQDTEVAWQGVRYALLNGPFDANREAAAKAIASKREPSSAGPLSTVIDTRTRLPKLAAIDAIAGLPGDKAPLIVLAFLNQEDPEVRLRATVAVQGSRPEVLRQLLYSAVNDTSDQIRWTSYLKLLATSGGDLKTEAYRGVRDDGVLVRLKLVQSFAENPNEEHRPSLRLAVVDSSPRVRAAALRAIALLPNGVEPAEVENTFRDPSPIIQLALLDLAEKGSIKLPSAAIASMKTSQVGRIAARARALG